MARPLVPNVLWAEIAPLLPPAKPRPKGGRPPVPDRAVLTGILFVLKSGIPWEMLPREMGCGSGDLLAAPQGLAGGRGLGQAAPHPARPAGPGERHRLSRCSLDGASVPAKRGAS